MKKILSYKEAEQLVKAKHKNVKTVYSYGDAKYFVFEMVNSDRKPDILPNGEKYYENMMGLDFIDRETGEIGFWSWLGGYVIGGKQINIDEDSLEVIYDELEGIDNTKKAL